MLEALEGIQPDCQLLDLGPTLSIGASTQALIPQWGVNGLTLVPTRTVPHARGSSSRLPGCTGSSGSGGLMLVVLAHMLDARVRALSAVNWIRRRTPLMAPDSTAAKSRPRPTRGPATITTPSAVT